MMEGRTNGGAEPAKPIGWGVVGCGWVARAYVAPALARLRRGRLVAACDRDPAALATVQLNTVQQTTGQPNDENPARTQDLAEMLAREDVDAVYVATPNDSHAAIVEQIAEAGKAVLCEKPMARTYAEAERMVAACERAGVRYATAFDQRFHPAHQRLQRLVAEGELGTVTAVRIHYACWTGPDWQPDEHPHDNWRADPDRAGGGALMDLAPHGLDLTQVLLGQKIERVAAFKQRLVHDYAVDDGAVLIGQTEGGVLLSHTVAYNCPETFPRRTLEVIGTRARALALNTMGQTPGGTLTLTDERGEERAVSFDAHASPFQRQVDAFTDALALGQPFPFTPQHDLHTMRLVHEANAMP
jgi:predicted dehydrogenase